MSSPEDRRRSPRVPLGVRVSGGTGQADLALAMGYARDISMHGMYVDLRLVGSGEAGIHLDTGVFLRFRPPNSDQPVDVEGVVRRVDKDDEGGKPKGIGVEFRALDERARGAIADYLAAQLAETLE